MDHRGFTLIELMVTVAIIAILAVLAFPGFSLYRRQGYNVRVNSDARSYAAAEEAYFIEAGSYTANAGGLPVTPSPGSAVSISPGNSGSLTTSFSISVTHPEMTYTDGCVWTSDESPSMSCS